MAMAGTLLMPAMTPIASAIRTLYGVTTDLNSFLDRLIEGMKGSQNPTVAFSGRVLEAAKFGFGVSYIASTILIAAGQLLLGHPLDAMITAATAAAMANPYVMTAAALGALVYGYAALSNAEREELHQRLRRGLSVGVELVKAIINFAIGQFKELSNSTIARQLKRIIADKAALFERSLGDITGTVTDRLRGARGWLKTHATRTRKIASARLARLGKLAEDAQDAMGDSLKKTRRKPGAPAAKTRRPVRPGAGRATATLRPARSQKPGASQKKRASRPVTSSGPASE